VQREVDLARVLPVECGAQLERHGAPRERIGVWGAPLSADFGTPRGFEDSRARVCRQLDLDEQRPLVLIAGGGEGLGQIEATLSRLLALEDDKPQFIVLTGRNERLKARCERLVKRARATGRVRVLGWIADPPMSRLMRACDLLVSKLGNTFNEALASELPLVALEPPPGSERVQYKLLDEWGTGRAVRTLDEMTGTVVALLADDAMRARIRERCRARRRTDAAQKIARWLAGREGSFEGSDDSLVRRDEVVSHG
jgi:UDP-N-acetylglucosamine:LPS N-acetylglucosamine transferase